MAGEKQREEKLKTRVMKIEHLAIWADDIELLRAFYMKYFNLHCGDKYTNPTKNFTSYFLSFEEGEHALN